MRRKTQKYILIRSNGKSEIDFKTCSKGGILHQGAQIHCPNCNDIVTYVLGNWPFVSVSKSVPRYLTSLRSRDDSINKATFWICAFTFMFFLTDETLQNAISHGNFLDVANLLPQYISNMPRNAKFLKFIH